METGLAGFGKTAAQRHMYGRAGIAIPYGVAAGIGAIFLFASAGSMNIRSAAVIPIAVVREAMRLSAQAVPGRPGLARIEPAIAIGAGILLLSGVFALQVAARGNAAFAAPSPQRIRGRRTLHGDADWMSMPEATKLFGAAGRNGVAAFGITYLDQIPAAFAASPLEEEQFVALVPAEHPFAANPSLRLADLADTPLVSLPRASRTRRLLDAVASAQGFQLNHVATVTQFATMLACVREGIGLAVAPAGGNLRRIPLRGWPVMRQLGTISMRTGSCRRRRRDCCN